MSSAPILLSWDGEAFYPASPYWASRADRQFVVGETYKLVEHHDRSESSHNHYFAAIGNAWNTLPDHLLAEYPTAEHLRKKMLVKCGYADERTVVCASKAEAERVAAFINADGQLRCRDFPRSRCEGLHRAEPKPQGHGQA